MRSIPASKLIESLPGCSMQQLGKSTVNKYQNSFLYYLRHSFESRKPSTFFSAPKSKLFPDSFSRGGDVCEVAQLYGASKNWNQPVRHSRRETIRTWMRDFPIFTMKLFLQGSSGKLQSFLLCLTCENILCTRKRKTCISSRSGRKLTLSRSKTLMRFGGARRRRAPVWWTSRITSLSSSALPPPSPSDIASVNNWCVYALEW
jgi:hypothetical protein